MRDYWFPGMTEGHAHIVIAEATGKEVNLTGLSVYANASGVQVQAPDRLSVEQTTALRALRS